MRASETIIAWNGVDDNEREAPAGSVALGPLLHRGAPDWTRPYFYTAGAAEVSRREMSGTAQDLEVMCDWYRLVFVYGLDPYVVHQAFLRLDEYQEIIKGRDYGPAEGEFGHDPEVGYGRIVHSTMPEIQIFTAAETVHVWRIRSKTEQGVDE